MAFFFFCLSITFEQCCVQSCRRATGPNLQRISLGAYFIPGQPREDGQQHIPKFSSREQNPPAAMNCCQRRFSMPVQEPSLPLRLHCLASPHDAAATTGSLRLKEVSKYNQTLAYPSPPPPTFWENPFLPKIIQMCFTARGEFVGKIRGSLDETFPEEWGWELVPLWSRPTPLTRLPLPELGLVRPDRFYPLMRTRE